MQAAPLRQSHCARVACMEPYVWPNLHEIHLDTSHSGGTEEDLVVLARVRDQLLGVSLWDALCDDCHDSDGGLLHSLHAGLIRTAQEEKINQLLQPCAGSMLPLLCRFGHQMTVDLSCFMASMLDSYALHQRSQSLQLCAGNVLPLLCFCGLQMSEKIGCVTAYMLCAIDTAPQGRSVVSICKVLATQNVCPVAALMQKTRLHQSRKGGYDKHHRVISSIGQPCRGDVAA